MLVVKISKNKIVAFFYYYYFGTNLKYFILGVSSLCLSQLCMHTLIEVCFRTSRHECRLSAVGFQLQCVWDSEPVLVCSQKFLT